MQCDNAQCGGAELLEVTVYTCRVCGRAQTTVDVEVDGDAVLFAGPDDLSGDSEFESDDSED